jgi:hypothetical protein
LPKNQAFWGSRGGARDWAAKSQPESQKLPGRSQANLRDRDFHRKVRRTEGREFGGRAAARGLQARLLLLNLGGIFFNSVLRIEKCDLASLQPSVLLIFL